MSSHVGVRTPWVLVLPVLMLPALASAKPIPMGVDLQKRGFEQIATKNGVKVYKHKASSIIRLGADGVLQGAIDNVFKTLLDYEKQVGAIDRLSKSQVLLRTKRSMIVYQRLNLPVISDRDFTLRVWWGRTGKVRWIRYAAQANGLGGLDGAVHVKNHSGSWQLEALPDGKTRARFEVQIDMGGWLPRWLAKSGSGKEVPALFSSIDKMLAKTARGRVLACTTSKCS